MKNGFVFVPDRWLGNRSLRACTPAARGFWVDLLALMHPTGYLIHPANSEPLTDEQIAQLTGSSVRDVRKWITELGNAGIFTIEGDRLCSTSMIKAAARELRSRAAGQRGGRPQKAVAEIIQVQVTPPPPPPPVQRATPAKIPDWWLSPAGWARMGQQCAIDPMPGETIYDYQVRVSARLPPGPHLEALSDVQIKMVEAITKKTS